MSGSDNKPKTVALVGRQNAGKTSVLMHLTGTLQRPVNFPGSSVERVEAMLPHPTTPLVLIDLPGLASLEAVSPDEEITVGWLKDPDTAPDVICAVLDATKLALGLPLVDALGVLGRPIVIALTQVDLGGGVVDAAALSAQLGLPIVPVNAHAPRSREAFDALGKALREAAISLGGTLTEGSIPPDYAGITALVRRVTSHKGSHTPSRQRLSDKIDRVVLHRFFGLPLFALLVFVLFQLLFYGSDPLMGLIEDGQGALSGFISGLFGDARPGPFESFLVDGLVGGLGATLIFLPQIAILIFLVSLLEASGFMARAAVLLDRPLSRVGLSGRSFVPLASSFACAVPGILATRTIENERERIATILVAPLMSCSARLPVYVLLIGAFFQPAVAGLVLLALYALGIVAAAVVALIMRRTALKGPRALLMLELPVYQRPPLGVVLRQVLSACTAFLAMAGTVILSASVIIWILSYYPRPAELVQSFEDKRSAIATLAPEETEVANAILELEEKAAFLEASALATVGKAIAPIFEPAGFDWRITVGILAAFPARELIIPTLGILYRVDSVDAGVYDTDELDEAASHDDGLRAKLREAKREDGTPAFSMLIALSLMVFFALCSQCVATLGAIKRETRSWKWPVFVFVYMTALAWGAAVLVYQIGSAAA